ncbi:hypothetical protein ACLOJK_035307 [Asimina triloba]
MKIKTSEPSRHSKNRAELEWHEEMQGMNVRFIHQFREGNLAADFLAKLGESGSNRIYEDTHDLPRLLRGIVRIDKSGLQAIVR